jgi:hypothetical protein
MGAIAKAVCRLSSSTTFRRLKILKLNTLTKIGCSGNRKLGDRSIIVIRRGWRHEIAGLVVTFVGAVGSAAICH